MKKTTFLSIILSIISLFAVSCQKETLKQDEEDTKERVVIPFNLKTVLTKVSYDGVNNRYSFKDGDKLAISSTSRADIEGELSNVEGNSWSGTISYDPNEGELEYETPLKVTLVHADNDDPSTYANGIAYDLGSSSSLLQVAIENYSLFTADITYGNPNANLSQQACFLNATVNFTFDNDNWDFDGQEGPVDVVIDNSLTISGRTVLNQIDETHYSTNFVIAMPGGTEITPTSVIKICDRDVQILNKNKTLDANKKYTVSRSLVFKPELGDPFWSDGTYGRITHTTGEVTGIIVFINDYPDDDHTELAEAARALTEKASGYGHALVMSLKNANPTPGTGVKWATDNAHYGIYTHAFIDSPSKILSTSNVSGYSYTIDLRTSDDNIAAKIAKEYRSDMGDNYDNTTGWFLPSIGQWVYSISERGFGGAAPAEEWLINQSPYKNWLTWGNLSNLVLVKNNGSATENLLVKSLNDRMQVLQDDFGCDYDSFGIQSGADYADNYWSSSESSNSQAVRMNFGSVETRTDNGDKYSSIKVKGEDKKNTSSWKEVFIMKVRPFLAF